MLGQQKNVGSISTIRLVNTTIFFLRLGIIIIIIVIVIIIIIIISIIIFHEKNLRQKYNFINKYFKEFENLSVEKMTLRKTWARIPAQSKASFFPQKDFQIL